MTADQWYTIALALVGLATAIVGVIRSQQAHNGLQKLNDQQLRQTDKGA